MTTHYDALHVDRDATTDKIKQAYPKLRTQNRLDKTKNLSAAKRLAGEGIGKFANMASEPLSDPLLRAS
jgi:DnaJ-class molecular chaperone